MGRSGRVTLSDVAKASGVSRATVSFVLNDDPRQTISVATRERVMEAAQVLGYVPHGIARALREGSSRVVVLNVDWGMEGNFSRSYVRGLDEELAEHEHILLVRHGHANPEATQKILDTIAPRAVLRLGEVYMRAGAHRGGLGARIRRQRGPADPVPRGARAHPHRHGPARPRIPAEGRPVGLRAGSCTASGTSAPGAFRRAPAAGQPAPPSRRSWRPTGT